jgi:hypothetical protein
VSTQTCSMCGWTGPQRKMTRWSVNPGGLTAGPYHDAANLAWSPSSGRWGKRGQWTCRDEAACQERQAQRIEKTGG